jgi:hypothetical protein
MAGKRNIIQEAQKDGLDASLHAAQYQLAFLGDNAAGM